MSRTKTEFRKLRSEMKSKLPERFDTGEEIEAFHCKFTTEDGQQSVNVLWLENDMGDWFELDFYKNGTIIDSITFDEKDVLMSFVKDIDSKF
jgi:hypothetical protein